ncbi:M23 family metallopeptidase [Hoeflea ulvae]|uniref:M23 family metallopeptidase n=1 Tax=Hoeflea ulvae TaxID=2983764 RepID=A0ABT3YKH7_9HYPH|nr:M23 family metallopeptidase [Hoeflea ulvae]MCY0096122.1 M23 family metallopeptidase [Hoeflea ulvae]
MFRAFLVSMLLVMFTGVSHGQVNGLEQGRARAEAFLAGEIAPIWVAMTPQLQRQLGTQADLVRFRERVLNDLGTEQGIEDEETVATGQGMTTYRRTANWSRAPGLVLMEWTFDAEGQIAGFFIRPVPVAASSRFLGYHTRADMRLPFEGTWDVVWGGRSLALNYHAADQGQRFAYDFLVTRDGASHGGDPARLEAYHCWGRPILSPASGTVVAAANTLPDNDIGQRDAAHPLGNHVILDMGASEFVFLAHLQKGSVEVEPGDEVVAGQTLGACGNSGNSTEPHLHLHVQTTAILGDGEGLPAQFQDYSADGTVFERGEPVRGQRIASVEEE